MRAGMHVHMLVMNATQLVTGRTRARADRHGDFRASWWSDVDGWLWGRYIWARTMHARAARVGRA